MSDRRRNPLSPNPRRSGGPTDTAARACIDPGALKRIRARRGCPDWVDEGYVESLRRHGTWWHIYQNLPEPSWWKA